MTDFKNEYKNALNQKEPSEQSLNELLLKMQNKAAATKQKRKKSPLKIIAPIATAACICFAAVCVLTLRPVDNELTEGMGTPNETFPAFTQQEIAEENFGVAEDGFLPDTEAADNDVAATAPVTTIPILGDIAVDTAAGAAITKPEYNESAPSGPVPLYLNELFPNITLVGVEKDGVQIDIDEKVELVSEQLSQSQVITDTDKVIEKSLFVFRFESDNGDFFITVDSDFTAFVDSDTVMGELMISPEAVFFMKEIN